MFSVTLLPVGCKILPYNVFPYTTKQHTILYSNNKYCFRIQNVQSTENHSKQDENRMKLKKYQKIGNTVNNISE